MTTAVITNTSTTNIQFTDAHGQRHSIPPSRTLNLEPTSIDYHQVKNALSSNTAHITGWYVPSDTSIVSYTAAEWNRLNVLLADGEIGVETDTRRAKVGNGRFYWSVLPYYVLGQDGLILSATLSSTTISPEETVTPQSGTVTTNGSISNSFSVVLTQNTTLSNPTNVQSGTELNFIIQQDAAGGHILSFGSDYLFDTNGIPVINPNPFFTSVLKGYYTGSGRVLIQLVNSYAPVNTSSFDNATLALYRTAIAGASLGGKRVAGANAIIAAFQPTQRLYIYQDTTLILPIALTGSLTEVNDGNNVIINMGAIGTVGTITTSDLSVGVWTFQLQGGTSYTNTITGTVGLIGSGADMILSINPTSGMGVTLSASFLVPRSIDGLT